jgi:hypothetical protein
MRPTQKMGVGTVIALAAMLGLLVLAGVFLYVGWGAPEGSGQMTTGGYIAMALGTVVTMALGAGLMFLMFYSNRHGRD